MSRSRPHGMCVLVAGLLLGLASPIEAQDPVPYQVVSVENTSYKAMGDRDLSDFSPGEVAQLPTNRRLKVGVVVPDSVRQNQVRPTVDAIIAELTSRRPEVDEIGLLLYSDSSLVDGAYDVARATWSTGGELGSITPQVARENLRTEYETSVQIRENLETYLAERGREEQRSGLTESKRREIFRALVRAEDRAQAEADQRYPTNTNCVPVSEAKRNVRRNAALADSLRKVYLRQVRQGYGITESLADSITAEAMSERWATPEMPPVECP